MRIVLPIVIAAALAIYALIDCGQSVRTRVRPPGKPWWLLIILVPIVGPVAWLVLGRPLSAAPAARPGPGPRLQPRPTGPDDDPDFLRTIHPVTGPRPEPPRPQPRPRPEAESHGPDPEPGAHTDGDPAPHRDEADHRNGPEIDPGDGDTR